MEPDTQYVWMQQNKSGTKRYSIKNIFDDDTNPEKIPLDTVDNEKVKTFLNNSKGEVGEPFTIIIEQNGDAKKYFRTN